MRKTIRKQLARLICWAINVDVPYEFECLNTEVSGLAFRHSELFKDTGGINDRLIRAENKLQSADDEPDYYELANALSIEQIAKELYDNHKSAIVACIADCIDEDAVASHVDAESIARYIDKSGVARELAAAIQEALS